MVRDKLGQEFRLGQRVIWCNYNQLWLGTVVKITAQRVRLRNIQTGNEHQPLPDKIVIVEDLPKQTLLWCLSHNS